MGKHKNKNADKLLLAELYKKVKKLEEVVENLAKKTNAYNINIEKMDIQKLENLTFHLDNLDINELSGSLNLGNNFGIKQDKDCSGIFRSKSMFDKKAKKKSPDHKEHTTNKQEKS